MQVYDPHLQEAISIAGWLRRRELPDKNVSFKYFVKYSRSECRYLFQSGRVKKLVIFWLARPAVIQWRIVMKGRVIVLGVICPLSQHPSETEFLYRRFWRFPWGPKQTVQISAITWANIFVEFLFPALTRNVIVVKTGWAATSFVTFHHFVNMTDHFLMSSALHPRTDTELHPANTW